MNKLFVGSLPFDYTNEKLAALFATVGKVTSAAMIPDLKNKRTRGFGFVSMSTGAESLAAIEKLNGTLVGEKKIFVSEGKPKEIKPKKMTPMSSPSAFIGDLSDEHSMGPRLHPPGRQENPEEPRRRTGPYRDRKRGPHDGASRFHSRPGSSSDRGHDRDPRGSSARPDSTYGQRNRAPLDGFAPRRSDGPQPRRSTHSPDGPRPSRPGFSQDRDRNRGPRDRFSPRRSDSPDSKRPHSSPRSGRFSKRRPS